MPSTTANARAATAFPDDPPDILRKREIASVDRQQIFKPAAPRLRGPEAGLDALLTAELVDLRQVTERIRQQPGFEQLVLRLSTSLALSPDVPPTTVEEAAIVLGTDRLRVLTYAWSLLSQHSSADNDSAALSIEDWTPEALYLASFFWWLGFDSFDSKARISREKPERFGVEEEQLVRLTEILLRDFMALIPFVEPALWKPRERAALAGLARLRKEEGA
ncbi:MAG TPA: hypothetical protein VEG64_02080 [Candidatus Sulfotelmatobacter sp.]|nr:hypothetical protein [Candidatus Sulfotelmatobacter sp.]